MSLADIIARFADEQPDEIPLIIADKSIGWRDLNTTLAVMKKQLKPVRGARLMLYIEPALDSIALLLASLVLEQKVILIADYYTKEKALALCKEFEARFLVYTENSAIKWLENPSILHPQHKKQSPSIGLLTSGTTGKPKCVEHNWSSLTDSVTVSERYHQKRWFCGYPLTHFAGMQVFVHCILNGGRFILPDSFDPARGREAIRQHAIDYLNCTPTYLRRLLTSSEENPLPRSLRHITLGGEVADQQLLDLVRTTADWVKVTHIYASSELGSILRVKDGRAGFDKGLLDGERLKIIDGELWAKKGGQAMLGYLNGKPLREEAWVKTGDCVAIEEDRVFFLGRKDHLINVGGYKASPYAIEDVIRQVDGVAAVLVMARKNALAGQLITAEIQRKPGYKTDEVRRDVIARCRQELPYYMQPRLFDFPDAIKITPTQKLIRQETEV